MVKRKRQSVDRLGTPQSVCPEQARIHACAGNPDRDQSSISPGTEAGSPDLVGKNIVTHQFLTQAGSLPYLDPTLIASLLGRARQLEKYGDLAALASMVESEQFRASLGRIACGYDGGQVVEE